MELAIVKKMLEESIPPGKLGLDEKLIVDADGRKAYKFTVEFFTKHGTLPTVDTVEQETEIGLSEIDASEPITFYVEQIKKRHRINRVGSFIKQAIESMDRDTDPDKVIGLMRGVLRDAEEGEERRIWTTEEQADLQSLVESYDRLKQFGGKPIGIELPWPTMNDLTGGLEQGMFASLIARSETGKSWVLIKVATHAIEQGKSVLFISPEMSHEVVRYRYASIRLGLPYRSFRKGMLSDGEEKRLREYASASQTPPFIIADAAAVQSVDQIDYYVTEHRPDLVIVDSYFLLDIGGRYSATHERREALTIALYNQAKRRRIPYFVSTHFTGKVRKEKKGEAEDVAYTKQAIRLPDLALGLHRNEDMAAANVMLFQILKNREGLKGDITMSFDLEKMDFSELKADNIKSEFGPVPGAGGPTPSAPPEAAGPAPDLPEY